MVENFLDGFPKPLGFSKPGGKFPAEGNFRPFGAVWSSLSENSDVILQRNNGQRPFEGKFHADSSSLTPPLPFPPSRHPSGHEPPGLSVV